jgi:ABC-type transporter Mla MlaB component
MGLGPAPEVARGDHACCVFASDDDQAKLIGHFAADALRRGDRLLYLANRADESDVIEMLDAVALDGRERLDSGDLAILHSSQMGLEGGFDRERMMATWTGLVGQAREDGYRGLAAAVEMTWALSWGVDLDVLVHYERTAGAAFASGELSALCQYDSRAFDGRVLDRASDAHPYALALDQGHCDVHYNRMRLHRDADCRLSSLGGEIDLANLKFLETELWEQLAGGDLTADCADLEFVDVAGSRLLHEAITGRRGYGRLELVNQPPVLRRVLDLLS